MIFKKSITSKFIVTVFIVLFIGQSIGSLIFFLHAKSALLDSLQTRINRAASLTAGVIAEPLVNYDYSSIDKYIEEIIKDEDIISIHILDSKGKVLKEKIKSADAETRTINPFLLKKSMSMKVPVFAGGEKFGEVMIGYSSKAINESISRNITLILLYQGIVLLAVIMVMLFLFNRNIKKPVSEINRIIERITMGDLSITAPELGDNEIGSIAKGITFLKERLSSTIEKLNSTSSNVLMAMKQVNVMNRNVTDSVKKQSRAIQDIIKAIENANKTQAEIISNTEKLSSFSSENVSSLLEMKATAEEIALHNQRLYRATEDSYAAVVQLTQAAKAGSKNSEEIVSAIEDTSASIEEIGASIKEVEEHSGESAKLAEEVKEITSDTGMLAVVNAVEGMDKISDEVKKSAEIIQRLGARSADIEKVLSVIKDVTEQTNLLSLNAAILAAQAGEYGKSFSVVAEEIRALSDRTASSTREIDGIVKTIQKDIKDAVRSIDNAKMKVAEGNSLALKVGDALKEILTASEHSTDMTKAIERATEEQALGLRQVTSAIEEIRRMMSKVAISNVEQEKALSYLLEGAGEVKEVADISKRGTEEQATGTKVISKNIELANDRITQINRAVTEYKKLDDEIVIAMEQIKHLGMGISNEMNEISVSLNTLFGEIEILKKEMEVFRTK
ncbi:MAG: methyl-accepting chemotaxis protein [Nitrospirota bacterium]